VAGLPKDLPSKSTAHYYFMLWEWDGTLARIHHAVYVATSEQPSVGAMILQACAHLCLT